ncbi:MAG: hypothetical protein COC16_00965 [Lutibacter sp.]|nr:MAG: hypothetical protein COC16_00965 [Lutibacter sp.]
MLLNKNNKFLYFYAFALFILSAFYGLLLRWNFTFPLKFIEYRNFLQSHSHVAFLGWGYLVTIGAIKYYFIPKITHKKAYNFALTIILVSLTLMLVSFPLSGYKVFSIVLLSVFGITSYILSLLLLKDIRGNNTAVKLIKYGIYYYLLSSLATWFLAGVLVTQGKTALYYNTIYFYLHFLYNGYFAFVLFGLLFKIFEVKQIAISNKFQKKFFLYLNIACIPAYSLSVLWSNVSLVYHIIGFVASILQLISLFFLLKIMREALGQLNWSRLSKLLLKFGLLAYSLKIIIQIASAFPFIVKKSLALKPFFIIGYLHLFTLGFMSVLLFLILSKLNILEFKSKVSRLGIVTFLLGILVTEFILFSQGFLLLNGLKPIVSYNLLLLIFSAVMIIGLVLIFVNQFRKQPSLIN